MPVATTALEKDIRIVIPAHKANHTLVHCIEAAFNAGKHCCCSEIIIVDNSQGNELEKLMETYPISVLKRNSIASAAYARNEGAKGFDKGILVFIDSDVIIEDSCIEQLVEPIKKGLCDAAIGNYSANVDGLLFSQKYKQLYVHNVYKKTGPNITNYFWTAISSVDADVFNRLNGFDTNFKGAAGEDQEFGIRLTRNNYKVQVVYNANGQHRHAYSLPGIIKNDFRKGISAVINSLSNRVPISHNCHAGKADILSVLLSVIAAGCFISSFFLPALLYISFASIALWFLCRMRLSVSFFKNAGSVFCFKAIALMYVLDLVRFICVILGVIKTAIRKPFTSKKALHFKIFSE
jgi:GT2 family glycosyltransferase